MNECVESNHSAKIFTGNPGRKIPNRYSLALLLNTALIRVQHWQQRSRQRKELARLDDHLLQDIGYTREQANVEAAKPFWK